MIKNQLKTLVLLSLLSLLLIWIGSFFGQGGLFIGLIFALIMNVGSYWFSDKIVLTMYNAKPIEKNSEIYSLIKEVSLKAKLPMPKPYIIETSTPNAFATGRNPKHAAIALTKGILDLLSKEELKGVIAHEMAHIKNRDTLITTIAATITSVISYLAMLARWAAIFGNTRDDRNGNIFELLILAIIMPIIATIIQLSISRAREYLADETGAKIIRNPHALADALKKLDEGVKLHPLKNENTTTASLFIVNPFNSKNILNLFSTHPPLEERIKRLKKMKIY